MYSNSKLNCLAHVAMTIMIAITSTTVTISHTNITNATLAASTTASTSPDARTAMTVVARTAAAFLSETSAVQLTNTKTTRTGFSISTNSTRVSMNITLAAAASPSETTPITTASKNNRITISTSTRPNSTKNMTFPPVQDTSRIITKQPPSQEISTKTEQPIHSKSTNNISATSNGTSTINNAFNTVNNKIKDSSSIVYVNTSYGGKTVGAENFGNLHVGNNSPSVDLHTIKKHHLQPKTHTSKSVNIFAHAAHFKTNNTGPQKTTPSTSPSPSHQNSSLPRIQFRDVGNALPYTEDIGDQKHGPDSVGDSNASTGIPVRKVRVERSSPTGKGNLTQSKTAPLKSWTSLQFPSKFDKTNLTESTYSRASTELNAHKRRRLNLLGDSKGKENNQVLKNNLKHGKKDQRMDSFIFQRSSDQNSANQKGLLSAMTSSRQDLFSWRGCPFCSRIKEPKKRQAFMKDQDYIKRMRHLTVTNPTKTEHFYLANTGLKNLDNKEEIPLSAGIIKHTEDGQISEGMLHSVKKIKETFDGFSKINPILLDTQKKEVHSDKIHVLSSQHLKDKTNSVIPVENTPLIDGDKAVSKIAKKTNFTNSTDIRILSSSSDRNQTSNNNVIADKVLKCKNDKSCPNLKPELHQSFKPSISISSSSLAKTTMNFLEASKKDITNQISKDEKSHVKSDSSGFTFGKYTQVKSLESGRKSKKGLNNNETNKTIYDKTKETTLKDKQSLLSENSSVQIRQAKKLSENHTDVKIPGSDSLPQQILLEDSDLTKNNYSSEKLEKNIDSMKTNKKNTYPTLEISGHNDSLNEDYTRDHFKNKVEIESDHRDSKMKSTPKQRGKFETEAEDRNDINGLRTGYTTIGPQRRILTENLDVITDNNETDAIVADEDYEEDDEKLNEEGERKLFKDDDDDDDDDDIWAKNVKPAILNNLKDTLQREKARREREYSWLRNAYKSITYRQSHDLFLDPEFEKKRLERKVLRRWKGHQLHSWQQGMGASVRAEDIYLPLNSIQPHRVYPPTISNRERTNDFQHVNAESRLLTRTKRSATHFSTGASNHPNIGPFGDEAIDGDDEHKPCGNHGRHRSHLGGMQHLTRHQRRDVHRASRARHRYPRDVRFPSASQTFTGDGFGKAAYFSGVRELLQLRSKKRSGLAQEMIPRQHFTIELWIKPEGGQRNPTVILGLFDMCHQDHKAKGWTIGIQTYEDGQEADARIYFSLETDRANSPSVLMSDRTYEPNRWVHVAASYTGKKMKLYINTALVGVQHLRSGDVFSVSASSCKEIFLGGKPYSKDDLYRGSVDQIVLWNFPLKHGDVVQNMFDAGINMDREKGIVFKESFDDLSQWKTFLKGQPDIHFSNIEDYRYDIQLVAPPCGKTVCDDPDVIRSYVRHSELRQEKKVRYRIVNVMDDDEENPKVSKFQTVAQHRALVSTFKQYNISWELEEVKLRNTSLRHKTVLLDCLPIQIGDKHCNRECQHTQTGNDGGDCDPDEIPCDAINLGNGRCDFECNRAYYEWDKGDCCQSPFKSANSTCLDPDSPHRIYLSMDEYKTALNVNGSTHLNVYLASWSLKGLATFPWEKHVYDVLGGTVVDTNSFGQPGKMDGLIHEFGHNLGLWHVHHGLSEVKCDDPCMEDEPSLELGDLCSDTAPTAQNTHCRDPDWTVQACGISGFKNTPYRNYMSYASGNCTNHFTPQQVARMHCYLDLVYQPWQTTMKPSPVPLPPKVVAATLDSVTFVWLPGLGDNVYGSHSECHRCTQDGALIQYASSARAPADSRKKLHWNKEEALGPPDAERCKASSLSWMQESYECKSKCYIEFMFKYHTVPQSISIWVIWKAAFGIKNVKFYFMDGSTDSLGPIRAFCDMPFTANLNYTKKVKKVRVYPNNTYVGIDAIQLISTPESARICSSCRPTKYRVMRSPDFPRPVYTSDTMYTDGSVMRGVNYSYTIQVNIGNKVSGPSPPLHYQHGQPFCGNGRVETNLGELCDDGNVNDGDGCTTDCEVEKFYRCKGTPSLCYRHDGDGICEEDEQNTSLRDCGYHTPEGYDDQWPVSAIGNPHYQLSPKCSEEVLIGAPTRFQVCKNNVELSGTWRPCNTNYFDAHDYWIKVYYARPVIAVGVVIYLGSDGRAYDSPEPKSLLVQLIDTEDRVTYLEHKLVASCQSNPIYVSILHDLSRPFFRTKGVKLSLSSSNIAIAGIRLRTSQHFDPITPESCSQEQFYNPRSQQCVNQTCPRKFCEQLITDNANTTCTGRGEGDICQVTCLDGYRIRNELDEVICADGVWRRSDEVSCIPVDCRWPAMVHATFICPQGTTFKQSCSFRCNPPAQLQGSGSMVTCEADGRWSMVNAYCLAFCHSPVEHPNAYPTSRSCQIDKAHQAGSRCKFRCEKGYHIEGMPAKRRSLHLTCKESGQWEGNKCVRVMCKAIPPEFTGMYTCSESTYGSSRCILKLCPGESRAQKIKCLQKGVWSSHFKMCNFPKSAMCPWPQLTDQRLQIRKCNNRSAGSTCEVTCNSQAYQPALPHMNGTIFDSKDRVMKLTCTGMLKWLPEPRHISCKGTCRVMSLKDGWCDSSNNRFFCAWDKGDCCASTVEGGRIRLDKPTCKSKCACKDPNAKENSNESKK